MAMTTATTNTEAGGAAAGGAPATLLQLMWLASPALPVGGFSYSEGLEAAVDAGLVGNQAQAAEWLSAQLQLALARSDLPALARAHAAWRAHDAALAEDVNTWLRCTRESAELRAQAEQMGRSMLDWLRNGAHAADPRLAMLAALPPAPLWPTAFALAAVLAGATPRDSLLAFAWSWAENMAQAAMKAVPLGQAAAQRVLTRLAAELPAAVSQALALPADEHQAYAPMLAILSAQHETQYSRLFRS
ncbi:MAG: urease accessory protein UreF [Leptothrix sp. (in: Bacteria)]|nr:urease accessory protein UreF [Leptothrix sp. (in: b-proteobacteria)]